MTLTEFLLARIAEDETNARDLPKRSERAERLRLYGDAATGEVVVAPSRVLAECEAKRRIVTRHAPEGGAEDWMDAYWLADMTPEEQRGHCGWCTYDARTVWSPCGDVRDLATVYADHPDYRDEWRL